MLSFVGVIPSRYGSTRLKAKPLVDICGKPLIQRVYESSAECAAIDKVVIATDDKRIESACLGFGAEVIMTPETCVSGTDRVACAVAALDCDVIINIQGDEPMISSDMLSVLTDIFNADPAVEMATLAFPLSEDDMNNPNAVKVVCDANADALYFSRNCIPYQRNNIEEYRFLKHLGVYAYKKPVLLRLAAMKPTLLEQIESLEQLRALYNGIKIRVGISPQDSVGVDTEEDLKRVNMIIGGSDGK